MLYLFIMTWWITNIFLFKDKHTGKTVVILGRWDEETHKDWLRKNPTKKPKPPAERK